MEQDGTKVVMLEQQDENEVVITDVKIPFWRMVVLILKWAAASFVAFIIPMLLLILIQGCLFGAVRTKASRDFNAFPPIERLR